MTNNKIIMQKLKLLGIHIKTLREQRNISISCLAKKTGIKKEYLQKIEKGTAIKISIYKHLFKIANELEINFEQLFDFE